MQKTLTIPAWAQGRTGLGQGGYTASRFELAVGQPLSIALKAPIPLETPMQVVEVGDHAWELRSGGDTIMGAVPSPMSFARTESVNFADAIVARGRSNANSEDHVAPHCRSCGTDEGSMRIWPGALADGTNRVATDWTPPAWAGDESGVVDVGMVWMALDCTSGFFLGMSAPDADGNTRDAVTVQFAAQIVEPLLVGEQYVSVGFDGHWSGGWDGRKRGAGACVFDSSGQIVAQADSFWLSLD